MSSTGRDVLIDASNLHVGGGVQVAASFLSELAVLSNEPGSLSQFPWLDNVSIFASSQVLADLAPEALARLPVTELNLGPGPRAAVDSRGLQRGYATSFVVFGPHYVRRLARRTIWGCADVTSFYSGVVPGLSHKSRLRTAVRSRISRALFSRQDTLIVETEAMRNRVMDTLGKRCPDVRVVANSYHGIFDQPERWGASLDVGYTDEILMACIARDYPHKNLDFLGNLHEQLRLNGTRVRFLVTLTPSEWKNQNDATRRACINVGALPISRVPRLYEAADAVLFPSLLEAFSATPLEALKMRKPLFASNRDFVKSIVGSAAVYFDPLDHAAAAGVIGNALNDDDLMAGVVARGAGVVAALPGAEVRALRYLEIIDDELRSARAS